MDRPSEIHQAEKVLGLKWQRGIPRKIQTPFKIRALHQLNQQVENFKSTFGKDPSEQYINGPTFQDERERVSSTLGPQLWPDTSVDTSKWLADASHDTLDGYRPKNLSYHVAEDREQLRTSFLLLIKFRCETYYINQVRKRDRSRAFDMELDNNDNPELLSTAVNVSSQPIQQRTNFSEVTTSADGFQSVTVKPERKKAPLGPYSKPRARELVRAQRIEETEVGMVAPQACNACIAGGHQCMIFTEAARAKRYAPGYGINCARCFRRRQRCVKPEAHVVAPAVSTARAVDESDDLNDHQDDNTTNSPDVAMSASGKSTAPRTRCDSVVSLHSATTDGAVTLDAQESTSHPDTPVEIQNSALHYVFNIGCNFHRVPAFGLTEIHCNFLA